ncbi:MULTISPECIES: RidA family protein [Comamonadaceae]|uniref:RidA family protein n=1 Tax=Comamonadaceae TaxID=80864 RepID=UPI00272290AC|nr:MULTISPECIES: RidA family protein [Comamonadaceae]MDO9143119.1 RidA family protein [Rhodoferax sp.]MDP3193343.1 RidA family protein [Rhodoferax sp.]MDP3888235.1 RidA family protein [Hydrogenophaga sp.]
MTRPPVPQGNYVAAKRHGDLVYTSGMTPRDNGVLMFKGAVSPGAPLENYQAAVELATKNALTAARLLLAPHERVAGVLSLTVYIAAEPEFTAHARLADFASAYLQGEIGDDGIGCRAAVGVASLPGNAPVEIQLVAIIARQL